MEKLPTPVQFSYPVKQFFGPFFVLYRMGRGFACELGTDAVE